MFPFEFSIPFGHSASVITNYLRCRNGTSWTKSWKISMLQPQPIFHGAAGLGFFLSNRWHFRLEIPNLAWKSQHKFAEGVSFHGLCWDWIWRPWKFREVESHAPRLKTVMRNKRWPRTKSSTSATWNRAADIGESLSTFHQYSGCYCNIYSLKPRIKIIHFNWCYRLEMMKRLGSCRGLHLDWIWNWPVGPEPS